MVGDGVADATSSGVTVALAAVSTVGAVLTSTLSSTGSPVLPHPPTARVTTKLPSARGARQSLPRSRIVPRILPQSPCALDPLLMTGRVCD